VTAGSRLRSPLFATALLVSFACAGRAPVPPAAPPAAREPPNTPPPEEAPAPTPSATTPVPARPLAWVNPARCLSPCDYDPAPSLVRVDDHAAPSATGLHQVASEIQAPLRALLEAAASAGHALAINSAYRSYEEQARVFRTTKQPGRAARPGHSEHQLGTAVDLRLQTPAAVDWLAAHAADFGFTRSYPPGKQKLTGYRPEPWHVRFVGPLAEQLRRDDLTLEEHFRAHPDVAASGDCAACPMPPPRKPCGPITEAGTCKGVLLSWCYEGVLATVDCSAFEQRCGPTGSTGTHDCR
jgi:D-alanyl-D-alanine carboxypeptidase